MQTKTFYIESSLGKIPAILYTPTEKKKDACVVFFHGRGESGTGSLTSGDGLLKLLNNGNHKSLIDAAEKHGFSMLAPQFVSSFVGWSPGWTDAYVEVCIDYALTLTSLPKVGVTGLSQGGGGTWIALTNPKTANKVFAAIAICPTPEYDNNNDFSLIAKYGIGVQNFHAKDDSTVNVQSSRVMVAKANAYNPDPPVKYEELSSGNHYIWGTVYSRAEIYPWLLSFAPKSTQPQPLPPTVPIDEIIDQFKTTIYKSGKIETVRI